MTTKRERNSPRGRIAWMRAIVEGETTVDDAFGQEMSYCLGCLACVTACPAGVDYPHLLELARTEVERSGVMDSPRRRFWRRLVLKGLFLSPKRFRAAARMLRWYQALGLQTLIRKLGLTRLLPGDLRRNEPLAPDVCRDFSDTLIAETEKPKSPIGKRAVMLTGCVQDVLFSEVNRATVDVLLAHGVEVLTPRGQGCCGSLHGHLGEPELAAVRARALIDQVPLADIDVIISNAGGCGSHLKHFGRLLADDSAYAEKAKAWDAKLKDIHEYLVTLPPVAPSALRQKTRATYHPSCHLHHGQGVHTQPEALLRRIPNLELIPLPDATWCCGSAGVYNVTQPEQAEILQEKKVANVLSTGAELVLTANPGCHLQLANGLKAKSGKSIRVLHPMSLLAEAYRTDH
jgi:glycolate oxidase iron-sulfur subunit